MEVDYNIQANDKFSFLIIEDDDVDAKSLERALTKARLTNQIFRAYDGIEAMAMLRGDGKYIPPLQPCVLIVDINMPRMSGIELIRNIRNDSNLKNMVVFILTTSNSAVDKMAAYDLSIAGYILKEKVGKSFADLTTFLEQYVKMIELP